MKKKSVVGFAIVALAALAVVLWVARWPAPAEPGVLAASGRIEGDQAAVGAKVGGKIVRLTVRESDRLQGGSPIAELASEQVLAQLQQAEHMLHTSREQLAEAQARVVSAQRHAEVAAIAVTLAEQESQARIGEAEAAGGAVRARLREAEANLEKVARDHARYRELFGRELIAAQQLDQAKAADEVGRAAVEAARKQVIQAEAMLELARASRVLVEARRSEAQTAAERVNEARAAVETARAQIQAAEAARGVARASLGDTRVVAPFIPPDFSRRIGQQLPAAVQVLVDGSNSNSALIALGYATRIVGRYARDAEIERVRVTVENPGPIPAVQNQRRAWYNPALRSVDHEVVSMLTLAVMMIAIILPAAGLAWEKEAGTIEQLLVMPFRPWELMLAKVVPTFVVTLASLVLALWVPWWFGVPIRGSLPLFFALSSLFLFSGLGLGLLLGTLAGNLQQALLLSFFTLFPVLVISGVVVPVESMPRPIQLLSLLSPLRYYLEIGLGVFLKGVGMDVLWPQAVAMGALGLGMLALGLWRFGGQVR